MAAQKRARGKRYFTLAEANAILPLLRSILRDVTELAHNLRDRHELFRESQVITGSFAIPSVSLNRDGSKIAIGIGRSDRSVPGRLALSGDFRVLDVKTRREHIHRSSTTGMFLGSAFSADGRHLAAA